MLLSIRLKIRDFFKSRKTTFIILLLVIIILIVLNSIFKRINEEEDFQIAYDKHSSVLDSKQEVPEKLKTPIEELINTYFNYCKTKDYENAYALISDGCKANYFTTLDAFKEYVDIVFNENKIYYIQNYSNYNSYYVYRMRIMDDILKSGMTGVENLSYYEEKLVVQQDGDSYKLGIRQYITTEEFDTVYEDDYLKIWVEKRDVFYEQEKYAVKIKNKTQYIAVLADGSSAQEVIVDVNGNAREALENELEIKLLPEETKEYTFSFSKFYDESGKTNSLVFNAIRILKSYTGLETTREAELNDAIKLYSVEIGV